MMSELAIVIDPSRLENADLDIRYDLPDLITAKSNGLVGGTGYDYVGPNSHLAVFFECADSEAGKEWICDTVTKENVLGNNLALAAQAFLKDGDDWKCFYPSGHAGPSYL